MLANKENLKLLLEFISKILEQDGVEWFHDELAILFSKKFILEKDTGIKLSAITIKELGSVDRYLEEGIIPIICYNDILDIRVRFQLERDAIEMGKFRLSKYVDSISFEKFCKYAHFQSEELINYYYQKISNGDVEKAKKKIKEYNKKFDDKYSNILSISSIPYSFKHYALVNNLGITQKYSLVLSNISKIRNLELHRDSLNPEKSDDPKLKKFILEENYNVIYDSLMHLKKKIIEALKPNAAPPHN